jgi:hypothetical protein
MIIGIGGWAFAGKDAVAEILERDHGFGRTYMSYPLEQALLKLDPLIYVSVHETHEVGIGGLVNGCGRYSMIHRQVGYDRSKKILEVRRLLQVLGTEVGREMFGEDVWVKQAQGNIDRLLDGTREHVVITGIRFVNEFRMIVRERGQTWWINRPGIEPVNAHVSDNTLSASDFDRTIENDGTLADLAKKVAWCLTDS